MKEFLAFVFFVVIIMFFVCWTIDIIVSHEKYRFERSILVVPTIRPETAK